MNNKYDLIVENSLNLAKSGLEFYQLDQQLETKKEFSLVDWFKIGLGISLVWSDLIKLDTSFKD